MPFSDSYVDLDPDEKGIVIHQKMKAKARVHVIYRRLYGLT